MLRGSFRGLTLNPIDTEANLAFIVTLNLRPRIRRQKDASWIAVKVIPSK